MTFPNRTMRRHPQLVLIFVNTVVESFDGSHATAHSYGAAANNAGMRRENEAPVGDFCDGTGRTLGGWGPSNLTGTPN